MASLKRQWHSHAGPSTSDLPPDTQSFLQLLDRLAGVQAGDETSVSEQELAAAGGLFRWDLGPLCVSRAPGRLDVMGGISDYSGALVLQQPTAEACHVACQILPASASQGAACCSIVSLNSDDHRAPIFSCPMSTLFPNGNPLASEHAQQYFKANPQTSWAAYVAGCVLVLAHDLSVSFKDRSVAMLVSSAVPEGKGVSSSAAVEVSTMQALISALGLQVPARDLALMCVKVENLVVGAPCGTMDQMACALGNAHQLLALRCQPAELQPPVTIPEPIQFWGIDTGERHSVGGCDYGSVRIGAFMGLRIATEVARRQQQASAGAKAEGSQCPPPLCKGYLANLSPSDWAHWIEDALPETMLGSDFLQQYGSHYDEGTTRIDPETCYAVRRPTEHPIFENHRTSVVRQVLSAPASEDQLRVIGELMLQSHRSYGRCRLGSPGTDRLVALVQEHMEQAQGSNTTPHLFGCKITGGGSGGTVCIVGAATAEAEAVVQDIISRYAAERKMASLPQVFRGSSMGCIAFGHVVVQR